MPSLIIFASRDTCFIRNRMAVISNGSSSLKCAGTNPSWDSTISLLSSSDSVSESESFFSVPLGIILTSQGVRFAIPTSLAYMLNTLGVKRPSTNIGEWFFNALLFPLRKMPHEHPCVPKLGMVSVFKYFRIWMGI